MALSKISDYTVWPGARFFSDSTAYTVLELIGEGTFGKVTRCQNVVTGELMAVKFVKKDRYADEEVKLLKTIRALNPDRVNMIWFYEWFEHEDMICLVFELLNRSLREEVRIAMKPMSLMSIRKIAQQLFVALDALHGVGILHTDINPDNIMFVNPQEESLRIKLIDFGNGMLTTDILPGMIAQALACRAPEIFLGLPFTEAIDVWGMGCVLGYLYMSCNFFKACSEYQMMKAITELVGQPEDQLIRFGIYSHKYFIEEKRLHGPSFSLMTPEEYLAANGLMPGVQYNEYFSSLYELLDVCQIEDEAEFVDVLAFMYLMKKLLNPVGDRRISAHQALQQPFITMEHLRRHPAYLASSQSIMNNQWSGCEASFPSAPRNSAAETYPSSDGWWFKGESLAPRAPQNCAAVVFPPSYVEDDDGWWSEGESSAPSACKYSSSDVYLVLYDEDDDGLWSDGESSSPSAPQNCAAVVFPPSYVEDDDGWWSEGESSAPSACKYSSSDVYLVLYDEDDDGWWSDGESSSPSAPQNCAAVVFPPSYVEDDDGWSSEGESSAPSACKYSSSDVYLVLYDEDDDGWWSDRESSSPSAPQNSAAVTFPASYVEDDDGWWSDGE